MDDVTDPDLIEEALILQPTDLLLIRISPDRVRSMEEFATYRRRISEVFANRPADMPEPIIVVAEQWAVRKSEAAS